jgi:hypothetical protein
MPGRAEGGATVQDKFLHLSATKKRWHIPPTRVVIPESRSDIRDPCRDDGA